MDCRGQQKTAEGGTEDCRVWRCGQQRTAEDRPKLDVMLLLVEAFHTGSHRQLITTLTEGEQSSLSFYAAAFIDNASRRVFLNVATLCFLRC